MNGMDCPSNVFLRQPEMKEAFPPLKYSKIAGNESPSKYNKILL